VIAKKKNAFSAFPSAQNKMKVNQKVWGKKWRQHQFSQVKGDLNLQKILKPIPISKKNTWKNNKDSYDILCLHSSITCSKNCF
jgi:hypothetical protein